jgi:hypothetical protein
MAICWNKWEFVFSTKPEHGDAKIDRHILTQFDLTQFDAYLERPSSVIVFEVNCRHIDLLDVPLLCGRDGGGLMQEATSEAGFGKVLSDSRPLRW